MITWVSLLLGRVGVERAAERTVMVARVGGPALAELYRLEASAARWERAGRPEAELLRGTNVESAEQSLARSASVGLATGTLREFVAASSSRSRRRRRRNQAVAAASALILVVASVIAVIARQAAESATGRARTEGAHAQSVRLAGLATGLVGVDPDLPWLLTREALATAPTAEALTAARRVRYTTPVHRTIRLDGLPVYLSTDPQSGRVAITFTDGRTQVRSTPEGAIVMTVPGSRLSPDGGNAIAPGGQALYASQKVLAVPGNTVLATLAGGDRFAGWIDPGRTLIVRDGRLAVLTLATGWSGRRRRRSAPSRRGPSRSTGRPPTWSATAGSSRSTSPPARRCRRSRSVP